MSEQSNDRASTSLSAQILVAAWTAMLLQIALPFAVSCVLHALFSDRYPKVFAFVHPWIGSLAAGVVLGMISPKVTWRIVTIYAAVSAGVVFLGLSAIAILNSQIGSNTSLLFTGYHVGFVIAGAELATVLRQRKIYLPIAAVIGLLSLLTFEQVKTDKISDRFTQASANAQVRIPNFLDQEAMPLLFPGKSANVAWDKPTIRENAGQPYFATFTGYFENRRITSDGTFTYQSVTVTIPLTKPMKFQKETKPVLHLPEPQSMRENGLNESLIGLMTTGILKQDGSYYATLMPGYGTLQVLDKTITLKFDLNYRPDLDTLTCGLVDGLRNSQPVSKAVH